ncbi:hypothetical protein M0R72_06785 [Candidatus Pacearchaeota archaeon]|jgi:hypothetical protein|nr:hypothetical protein [Candidatus Pacearchaeota archaeon]
MLLKFAVPDISNAGILPLWWRYSHFLASVYKLGKFFFLDFFGLFGRAEKLIKRLELKLFLPENWPIGRGHPSVPSLPLHGAFANFAFFTRAIGIF